MDNARVAAGIPVSLLAHQGGWDEILLVAVPIVVVACLLWLARRRVTGAEHSTPDVPGDIEQSGR